MTNEEFHDALYRERCRREVIENENRRLRRLLEKARDEFAGLPHSLGYEFTHLPEIEAELNKTPSAIAQGREQHRGEASPGATGCAANGTNNERTEK